MSPETFSFTVGLIGLCCMGASGANNSFSLTSSTKEGFISTTPRSLANHTQSTIGITDNPSSSYDKSKNKKRPCKLKQEMITCKSGHLDLSFIGCSFKNATDEISKVEDANKSVKQNRQKKKRKCHNSKHLCEICGEYEAWSTWSECCLERTCQYEKFANLTKYRRARYREINKKCQDKLDIDPDCAIEISRVLCHNKTGKISSIHPDVNPGHGNNNKPVFSVTLKISIFAIAGVVMIGLFGFAGIRLLKTINRQHPRRRNSSLGASRLSYSHNDSQYSNASFRSDSQTPINVNHQLLVASLPRGHRMAPSFTRLSIIQEEDDAVSGTNQDGVSVRSENASISSKFTSAKFSSNPALDYMDGIITQIEDDERAMQMEDNDFRSSIVKDESFKLLNQYGWNPHVREENLKCIERLKPTGNDGVLLNSDLSLASASLLQQATDTSSHLTSSLSESEADCYSLRDISDLESPTWQRQFSSEPDLTRSKHMVPDIDDVLTDSDFNVNQNDVCL